MAPLFRLLLASSILACAVASCAGEEFTSGSNSTVATGGSAGTEVGTAGTMGTGTAGVTGSGGSNGSGGGVISGAGGTGTGGTAGTASGGNAGQHAGGNAGSSTGGASVDAGRDGGQCPTAMPANGQMCSSPGLSCRYGDCCPSYADCINGTWQLAFAKCPAPVCPDKAPVNGSSCACFPGLACLYDACSMTQQMTDATCVNTLWKASTYGCENACGVEDCMAGQICLVKGGQSHCVLNPCLPQRLACACATSLCPAANICTVSSAVLTCQ